MMRIFLASVFAALLENKNRAVSNCKVILAAILTFTMFGMASAATLTVKNTSAAASMKYDYRNSSTVVFTGSLAPGQSITKTGTFDNIYIYNTGSAANVGTSVASSTDTSCSLMYSARQFSAIQSGDTISFCDVVSTCPATTLNWGASNSCAASAAATDSGNSISLTNSKPGASGSATASCSSGAWSVTASSCTANLVAPSGLFATDGSNSGSISITWGASSGASTYRLQYRKQGTSTWADLTAANVTNYNWTGLTDESTFEFQVRSENGVGVSPWSAIETGYIRPAIAPLFISQTGIPAKIGVGQSFSFSQTWKNDGSETWAGGIYGTGPGSPSNSSVWNAGFTPFSNSVVTNSNTTTSITATAPTTPGIYPIQRVFWKSGAPYGAGSTIVNVEVVASPNCTAITPNLTSTYNANGSITITLQGASSVESASIKAWGDFNGPDDVKDYPMVHGSSWAVTIPIAAHITAQESKINFEARVGNSLFAPVLCASTSVAYQQLPVPAISLTPTMGSFDAGTPRLGFVADRSNGIYANIKVDLGAFSHLKTKIEFTDGGNSERGVPIASANAGVDIPLRISSSRLGADVAAWASEIGFIRVSYADPDAASQQKTVIQPISVLISPQLMQVVAEPTSALPQGIYARVHANNVFNEELHGKFDGSLRSMPDSVVEADFARVDPTGQWTIAPLDYARLFRSQLVAVARAVPPEGVTLFKPVEYFSPALTLPVQAPLSVVATDGTRENDVQIQWPAVATGNSIRYRVYRDATELTPQTGTASLEIIDVPPQRGTTYQYSVKTMINNIVSQSQAQDSGFVPSCRAARLIGASLNADMSAINGLIERWDCLEDAAGTGTVDAGAASAVPITGNSTYRSFSYVLDPALADGAHVLRLGIDSKGVVINAARSYDIPFTLGRSSISLKSLSILYDGSAAQPGLEATSIGRFGVRMEGGAGLGFAEEIK